MTDATGPATTSAEALTKLRRPRQPVPFHRLLSVETRKFVDTRSSRIMLAILVALTIAFIVGRGIVVGPQLHTLVRTAAIGYVTLLPVLGILSVTGEWSHRTALVTFALEPRRLRVLAAKCVPPVGTALAASLFAMLVAVPVTAVVAAVQDTPANWTVSPQAMLGWTGANVLVVAMGLAVGMLLLNAPAAIVISLSTATLWTVVSRLGAAGETLAEWLDLNTAAAPLAAGEMTGGDAARLATSMVVWIILPAALGFLRGARKEVR